MRTWLNVTLIAGFLVASIVAQEGSGINQGSWDVMSSAQNFWGKINGTEWTRRLSDQIQGSGEAVVDSVRSAVQSETMTELRKKVTDYVDVNQWRNKMQGFNYSEWRENIANRVNVTDWSNKLKDLETPKWMTELSKSVVNASEWLNKIGSRSSP